MLKFLDKQRKQFSETWNTLEEQKTKNLTTTPAVEENQKPITK